LQHEFVHNWLSFVSDLNQIYLVSFGFVFPISHIFFLKHVLKYYNDRLESHIWGGQGWVSGQLVWGTSQLPPAIFLVWEGTSRRVCREARLGLDVFHLNASWGGFNILQWIPLFLRLSHLCRTLPHVAKVTCVSKLVFACFVLFLILEGNLGFASHGNNYIFLWV
jgi:hypothetical protein